MQTQVNAPVAVMTKDDFAAALLEILAKTVKVVPAAALAKVVGGVEGSSRTIRRTHAPYRPRVTYRVTFREVPKRKPLTAATAPIYEFIAKNPGVTAQSLQSRLRLRDGQLWGALRRLTEAKLIRTLPPEVR